MITDNSILSEPAAEARVRLGRLMRARRQEAGVTLVEVLIVVAIMAMLAGGVAVFALPKFREAQVATAKTSAQVMRRAVQDWQRVNNEVTCPSESELVQGKHLDSSSNPDDPWGMPWKFVCTEDDVFVQSTGPDKKDGTADDISIPQLRANEEG
jgi:general secretion pathway protein G